MGRTKKFISKDEGQKFYLVHRSQTDEAYTTDGKPSDFVLIKAGGNGNDRKRVSTNSSPLNIQDHITPLGFKNDGYDYSQHLKVMGGGRFVGRNGKSMDLPYQDINLPADAFPSDIEVPRNLQAITIDHELMDEDIRDALFGNNQEDFEELADDFITEALKEPEQPDFDYEAHIANLLLKSERSMGIATAARGWDNNDDDLEEFEYEDDEEFEESHRRIGHSSTSNNNKNNVEKRRVSPNDQLSETTSQYSRYNSVREEERQERLDEQLDAVLEEYEEEEIGDLDEHRWRAELSTYTEQMIFWRLHWMNFCKTRRTMCLQRGCLSKKGLGSFRQKKRTGNRPLSLLQFPRSMMPMLQRVHP